MLLIMDDCRCELIMMPRSRITSAGTGFRDISYVLKCFSSRRCYSSSATEYKCADDVSTYIVVVVFRSSLTWRDSTSIPNCVMPQLT
jgi:hypothetical protein